MKSFLLLTLLTVSSTAAWSNENVSADSDTLTQQQLEGFGREAKNRISTLVDYLGVIVNKNRSYEERKDAIRQASLMFSEKATVEVSNIKTGMITRLPIRQYLEKIKMLSYDRVEIKSYWPAGLSVWKKVADGSYQASGQYFLEFEAWRNGNTKSVEADESVKIISAELKTVDDPFYGGKKWMLLFTGESTMSIQSKSVDSSAVMRQPVKKN
ncbi:hypothetical protein [Larkinella rosea]|uniref:Uncharacterized protein n=1 Tax=Larkinella rosea TaxID=2025312 RepID=A0A3P1BG74_9BACT|nr:hypothetical protein [Larkinella rosea]RRB00098.1 hypothetical protein EHT25_26100 [Larkinella rosea]